MENTHEPNTIHRYLSNLINKKSEKTLLDLFLHEVEKTKYCPVGSFFRNGQMFYFDFEATIDDLTCILPSLLLIYYKQHKTDEDIVELKRQIENIKNEAIAISNSYGYEADNSKKIQKIFTPLIDLAKDCIIN